MLLPSVGTALTTSIGSYRVTLTSKPNPVPVGAVTFVLKLRSAKGNFISGAKITGLTQMPSMPMGEKTEAALPSGQEGIYFLPANLAMAGSYGVHLTINGSLGHATGTISIATGENLGTAPANDSVFPVWAYISTAIVGIAILFALIKAYGLRKLFKIGNVLSVLALVGCIIVGKLLITRFRSPGSMTPIDAMTMNMDMPPPPGAFSVTAFKVQETAFQPSTTYPATVAASQNATISSRVTGTITWMPFYPGDKVQAGQTLAKIDPSDLLPAVSGTNAGVVAARSAVATAEANLRQAQAGLQTNRAKIQAQIAATEAARYSAQAANEAISERQSELTVALSAVSQSEATLKSAQREFEFRSSVAKRDQALFAKGFVAQQKLDEDQTKAEAAKSSWQSAQAAVTESKAAVQAKSSAVRSARFQAEEAESDLKSTQKQSAVLDANLKSQQAMVSARASQIQSAVANFNVAKASALQAETSLGYTQIVSPVSGVISKRILAAGSLATPGQGILVVTDTDYLRVQSEISSTDLSQIHVGSPVNIILQNGRKIGSVLAVVPPTADPSTKLAIVEADIPWAGSEVRPGDYVKMQVFFGSPSSSLVVPSDCLLSSPSPNTALVWKIDPKTKTVSSASVVTGTASGNVTQIVSGLANGDEIVAEGTGNLHEGDSVMVASTIQRAGSAAFPSSLRPPIPGNPSRGASISGVREPHSRDQTANQTVIQVGSGGFTPSAVSLSTGTSAVWFKRTTNQTCATSVVFPSLHLRKDLPLGRLVEVRFPPRSHGKLNYQCGMDMFHGSITRP